MTDEEISARITRNAEVLGGKPIIRGTRVAVDLIVDFIADGLTPEQIVEDYPDLTREDVLAALAFSESRRPFHPAAAR
jgi:uncharacterized protein (DUF433 family)